MVLAVATGAGGGGLTNYAVLLHALLGLMTLRYYHVTIMMLSVAYVLLQIRHTMQITRVDHCAYIYIRRVDHQRLP